MRKPPGLRGSWLPSLGDAPRPAAAAAPAIPAAPVRSGAAAAAAASKATGFAATRPFNDFQPTRPLADFQATRPLSDFQPTRPVGDFQATRPLGDFQPTRPLGDFQPTRPLGDFQPTRPLEAGAAAPITRRTASAPAAAIITPPSADGHWQVRGTPGQNLVLMPGQMHLGPHVASLRTLLGSCVAITLWHPQRRIGGMCHFLLPKRARRAGDPPDGRYGDEAVAEMVRALTALKTSPGDYVAHLYGGADTLSGVSAARFNIGERNIEQGWALIDQYGFQLDGVDVGEDIPRTVALTLATGVVSMRRGTGQAPDHLRA